jgi:hypothetical protein
MIRIRFGIGVRLEMGLSLVLAAACAADKPVKPASAGNENVDITAAVLLDRKEVSGALGADPGTELVVIDVKFAPRGENTIKLSRDDFTLISRKDGQKSQPLHPSQIAGGAALVVASSGRGGIGGGIINQRQGPVWGGVPGTGDRPRRLGGDEDVVASGSGGEQRTTVKTDAGKTSPVLAALKEKELPQTETNGAVSGLLYFFLEGKHKLKDLELMYKGPAGALNLDFIK